MGILRRGILGGFSNKVGNIVGTTWKGRAVIKSLPLSVANPRTTPQVNQRTKFGTVSNIGSALLSQWVKPLWDRFSGDISGYNAFCRTNIVAVTANTDFDGNLAVMSKGKMNSPSIASAVADLSLGTVVADVTVPIDATWGQNGSTLYVTVVSSTNRVGGVSSYTVDPSDVQPISVALPADAIVGIEVYLFCALKRADGTQVSNATMETLIVQA